MRYSDFDAVVVEELCGAHLGAGAQAATIITSVSQGGSASFELEFHNGRNRASQCSGCGAIPDNRNELGGGGTYTTRSSRRSRPTR